MGQTYQYDIAMSNRTDVDGQGTMVEFGLSATARIAPTRRDGERTDLVLSLDSVKFRAEDPATQAKFDELAAELSRPYYFSTKSGLVIESRFRDDVTAFAVGILRNLSAALQMAEGRKEGEEWTSVEHDGTGRYLAKYARKSDGSLEKSKLRYEAALSAGKSGALTPMKLPVPEVIASRGAIVVEDRALKSVTLDEQIKVELVQGQKMTSTTSLKLSLTSKNAGEPPKNWESDRAATAPLAAEEPFQQPIPLGASDAARMEGLTFEKVLETLERLAKDPNKQKLMESKNQEDAKQQDIKAGREWTDEWSRVFSAVPAFYRQQPETIPVALEKIRAGSKATNSLLGGLSSAGTPEAQAALGGVLADEKLPFETRRSAAILMVRIKNPTAETSERLEALLEDPQMQTHAIYGIGTLSRRLREGGDAAEADRLGDLLSGMLEKTKDATTQMHLLRGLANSGYLGALNAVKKYLSHTKRPLRGAAVDAVRLMPGDEVDRIIAAKLDPKQEDGANVRTAAVDAAQLREATEVLRRAVSDAALGDESPQVRYRAVTTLRKWAKEHEELRAVLAKVASADAESSIRSAAQEALDR